MNWSFHYLPSLRKHQTAQLLLSVNNDTATLCPPRFSELITVVISLNNLRRPLVFVVCFYQSGDCQFFNFKIFHFVVKDIPVQIWYKLPDISSGTSSSPKMKKCDTTLSIVPHKCLVFLRHPVRKAIKNGC